MDAAVDTLHRDELGQVLKADERPFAAVARAAPEQRSQVLAARGQRQPSPEAQQALIFLAAHAAAAALREDPQLGNRLLTARAALSAEGATEPEVDQLIASLVLEEAFGADAEPDEFDAAFFEDTLGEIPELAKLTRERVTGIGEAFTRTAPSDWKTAHRQAAQAVIEVAWSEGPAPVNHEHVEEALERVRGQLGDADAPRAVEAVRRFLSFLNRAGLVSKTRLQRLLHVIDAVAMDAPPGGALQ